MIFKFKKHTEKEPEEIFALAIKKEFAYSSENDNESNDSITGHR